MNHLIIRTQTCDWLFQCHDVYNIQTNCSEYERSHSVKINPKFSHNFKLRFFIEYFYHEKVEFQLFIDHQGTFDSITFRSDTFSSIQDESLCTNHKVIIKTKISFY